MLVPISCLRWPSQQWGPKPCALPVDGSLPTAGAHEGPRRYAHSSLAEKYFGPWSRPSESLADLSRGQPEVAGDHVSEAASTAGLCEIAPVLLGDSISFCVDAPPALRGLHCSSFIHVRKGAGNGA